MKFSTLLLGAALASASLYCLPTQADTFFRHTQYGLEFGPEIYQGSLGPNVILPQYSGRFSFVTRYDIVDWFALVGKVTVSGFYSTRGFSDVTTSPYFGGSLGYNPCIRLKMGIQGVVPYVEGGVISSVYVVSLGGISGNMSPTQTALKFGYTATFGVDWFADQNNGLWGMGMGVTYFGTVAGPGFLDFPISAVGFSGFRIDFHVNFSL